MLVRPGGYLGDPMGPLLRLLWVRRGTRWGLGGGRSPLSIGSAVRRALRLGLLSFARARAGHWGSRQVARGGGCIRTITGGSEGGPLARRGGFFSGPAIVVAISMQTFALEVWHPWVPSAPAQPPLG